MAATFREETATQAEPRNVDEPFRTTCGVCKEPVIAAVIAGKLVLADPFEWEPRAACPYCGHVEGRGHRRGQCPRCDSSSYIGEDRPRTRMVAIDIAWSDEGGVRIIGPKTSRRRGEGLYRLHICG